MDSLNRLPSIIASLEDTLGHCINGLNNGGDVSQVISCLASTQQALSMLRPILGTLVQLENEESLALFSIKDAAIELLLSLDSTQPSYEPRPHDENIDLIHSILECYPDTPSPPDNVVHLPVKKDIAAKFGISTAEATQSLAEMMAVREELGLSNEGKIIDPSTVHFKH